MRRRTAMSRRQWFWGLAFAAPWLIGLLVLELYPMVMSAYLSLTHYHVFTAPHWIGLRNYRQLLADPLFWLSLRNTLFMVVVGIPLNLATAFGLANLLNARLRGVAVFRTAVYLPTLMPAVAGTLLWMWLLNPVYGLINWLLSTLGLHGPGWFSSPVWSKPALIVMGIWGVGAPAIIFLAALQGVPEVLYEAARIDGAGRWRRLRHITLPLVSPATLFLVITGIIGTFQLFTSAYVVTGGTGGQDNSLLFTVVYLYQLAFTELRMGYASALAWILFLVILAVSVLTFRATRRLVYYEGG